MINNADLSHSAYPSNTYSMIINVDYTTFCIFSQYVINGY